MRVHPHDLDEGQGPYPGRVIIRPQEHGQVGRDAQEREDLGTRRDPPAQQRQRRQPARGPDPARPAAIACRRTDQGDGRAHPCGQQDDPGHTARACAAARITWNSHCTSIQGRSAEAYENGSSVGTWR